MTQDFFINQNNSVTEISRASRLFTNRHKHIKVFISYLNDNPSPQNILFFHGDGGNGKSLLLLHLKEHFCKCFKKDNWGRVKRDFMENNSFDQIMNSTKDLLPIAFAEINFDPVTTDNDLPQYAFNGLIKLRRQLGMRRIPFPVFDYACVWHLYKTNKLSQKNLKEYFPEEEFDFIYELVDALGNTKYGTFGKVIINIFAKHIKFNIELWLRERKLNETKICKIQQLHPETDLISHLPDFFIDDINAALKQPNMPQKVVLFFDTHEAFWGHQRGIPEELYFSKDEWFRRLIRNIIASSPDILTVVAGRELPKWEKATEYCIPKKYINAQLIENLSFIDANKFLQNAEISDSEVEKSFSLYNPGEKIKLQNEIIAFASVGEDQIHPFYLGLLLDIVLLAAQQNEKLSIEDFHYQPNRKAKERKLINRFLKYVDPDTKDAVIALSKCRAFNQEIFVKLGQRENLNFNSTNASFNTLCGFSFIRQAEDRGKGWYRIHKLLQRLFAEQDKQITEKTHEILEVFFRKNHQDGDKTAIFEAIYHANRIDKNRGVEEWIEIFSKMRKESDFQSCRILLQLRRELIIGDDFRHGRVFEQEGFYYHSMFNFLKARQKYKQALIHYDKVLKQLPNDGLVNYHKGLVRLSWADLKVKTGSTYKKSLSFFNKSLASLNEAILASPDNVDYQILKGNILNDRGNLEVKFDSTTASKTYSKALKTYNQALKIDSSNITAYNNKAFLQLCRGNLEVDLINFPRAKRIYSNAIKIYKKILEISPENVSALTHKGLVLRSQGDLEAKLNLSNKAMLKYKAALDYYETALKIEPYNPYALIYKGLLLIARGNLENSLELKGNAIQSYTEAIEVCNQLLERNPEYLPAQYGKADLLKKRGLIFLFLKKEEGSSDLNKGLREISNLLNIEPNNAQFQELKREIEIILNHMSDK